MPFDGQIPAEPSAPQREPGCVRAVILYNPLDPNDRTVADIAWESGKTVAEYLDGLPQDVTWTVGAAGRLLQPEEWGEVTLIEGDTLVLAVTPEKGNQGLMIVAALVIAVASAGAASWASGAMVTAGLAVSATSTSAVVAGALVGAAVSIGGSLLMNAVFPAATAKASGGAQDASDSPSYSLAGPQPTSTENVPMPLVYGEFEVGGNRINAFTENSADGKAQWLYLQYAVSEGPIEEISEPKINDQPASNFRDVLFDWRRGEIGQPQLGWFIDVPVGYADGRTLSQTAITYNTVDPVDRIQLDLNFPLGLGTIDKKTGNRRPASVGVRAVATPIGGGPAILLQGSHWADTGVNPSGDVPETGIGIRVVVEVNGANGTASSTPYAVGCIINQMLASGPFMAVNETRNGQVANNYVAPGNWAAGQELVVFEFTHSDLNLLEENGWQVFVSGGSVYSVEVLKLGHNNIERQEKSPFIATLDSGALPRARYQVTVWRDDAESTSDTVFNRVVLSQVREIQADPVRYNRTAYYALKVRMTEQLNGVPKTTVKVKGRRVNIYDRNGNVVINQWSNNPADVALDLLLSRDAQRTMPLSRIDFPWFARFRQHCYDNALQFNGVFDYMTNTWDALVQVMRVGRASPVAAGLKWSGVIEAPSDPVMMFGSQNIIKGSFRNNWLARTGRANSIEGQYYDNNDGYKQRSVFAIDYTALARGDDLVQTTINLIGVTNPAQAQAEVDLQLRMNQYLVQSCSFRTGYDALGCTIGDVIYVQHDMPKWGWGDRIRSIAGNVVEIYNPMLGQNTGEAPLPVPFGQIIAEGATEEILVEDGNPLGSQTSGYAITPGPLFPEGDWRILVLKPAVQRASHMITAQSGTQITVNGTLASDFKITRIKIGTQDYGVLDTVRFASTTAFVLDRSPGSVAGLQALLWQTDLMLEGSIARPSENDIRLTITSWTHPFAIEAGDQVLIGRVGKFKKPFRITKIGRDASHQRTVECMEYVAEVYNPTGQTPDNDYSELSPFPLHVGSLGADQITQDVVGGGLRYYAKATWQSPLNDVRGHAGAAVWVSIGTGDFVLHENAPVGRSESIIEAEVNQTVRFKVIAYDQAGIYAPGSTAPVAAVTIGRRVRAPAAPTGLSAFGGIRLIGLSWTRPDDADIKAYEIFENTANTWATAYKVGESTTTHYTRHGLMPRVTRYYWVRSISYAGEISVTPAGPVSAMTDWLLASDIADGILNTAKFASSIAPVGTPANAADLAELKAVNQIVFPQSAMTDATTGQALVAQRLYRWTGSTWVAVVSAPELSGTLSDAQINDLNASKLTGSLAASIFPAGLRPIEILAALPATGNFAGRMVFLTTDSKLYRHTGTPSTAAGFTAATAVADMTGQITATQITDGAITTPKIAAGSIDAGKITAGAITSDKIAAGAVSAGAIAAGAVTASKILIGDTNNAWSDFDMIDSALYASSTGSPYTFVSTTASSVGQRYLQITGSLLTASVETAWFPVEVSADYRVYGAPFMNVSGATSAKLEIEFGSLGANGAITATRRVTVGERSTSSSTRMGVDVLTASNEKRARFVMSKTAADTNQARFGGFIIHRRANGELLVDGSISAAKLAAGSITAEKLAVGSPNNFVWNSCLPFTTTGWLPASYVAVSADPDWRTALGSGMLAGSALANNTNRDIFWSPYGSTAPAYQIPAAPGETWEVQAKVLPTQGLHGLIYMVFFDAAGTLLSAPVSSLLTAATPADGKSIDRYVQLTRRAIAPAGTVSVRLGLRMRNQTGATIAAPVMYFTQVLLGRTTDNAASDLAWVPGGVTEINGGMIKTGTIQADHLAANSITADKIQANAITAGKIAAGAITSSEIAAGEIKAVNLASETLITSAAQMGTAVITSAKIGDLEIGTLKIANNAVTSIVASDAYGAGRDRQVNTFAVNGDAALPARYLITATIIGAPGVYYITGGEGTFPVYSGVTTSLYRGGTLLRQVGMTAQGVGCMVITYTEYLGPGFYTWSVDGVVSDSNAWASGNAGVYEAHINVAKLLR